MKKTVTFVWSIFLLVFISIDMNAQSIKSWDYPIKPGTEAWQALSTHEDMLKACQIPAEILKTVSTEELIELCLAYPLLGDIMEYRKALTRFPHVLTDYKSYSKGKTMLLCCLRR